MITHIMLNMEKKMSCINQILKITKNQPYTISKGEESSLVIEGGGEYRDYEYLITFTDMGHRCGYVAVKGTEEWHDKESFSDIPVECHGGVTFYDSHKTIKNYFEIACKDKWIGFDCAHSGDLKDKECLQKYGMTRILKIYEEVEGKYPINYPDWFNANIRDYGYVEEQCKSIIDQILTVPQHTDIK